MQHSIGALVRIFHAPTGDEWTGILIDVTEPFMTDGIASIDVLVNDVIITLEPSLDGQPWFDITANAGHDYLYTGDTYEVHLG